MTIKNLTEGTEATEKIIHLFDSHKVKYQRIFHAECRTSEESAKARAEGGGGYVIGAKAILMKVERKTGSFFDVFVLPGSNKIDSKVLKKKLDNLKSFRFSTAEEMAEKTGGLVPGTMPPFAKPIFEDLGHLFIDSLLLEHELVGFNAACLTQSIVVSSQDYVRVATPAAIFPFSC